MKETTRVLLPELSTARDFINDQGPGQVLDLSIYPILVDELISYGVIEFAVVGGSGIEEVIPRLPQFIRNQIKIIDVTPLQDSIARIFAPLEVELDTKLRFPPTPAFGCWLESESMRPQDDIAPIIAASAELYPALFRLLIGMKNGLHIEMELPRLIALVDIIYARSRSLETRSTFALVKGILKSYETSELESVQVRSTASRNLTNFFEALVEEPSYRELSNQSHAMGYPKRARSAVQSFGRSSRNLLKQSRVRGGLEYAARLISTVFSIPEPTREFVDKFSGQDYLPPAFSRRWVSSPALRKWTESLPDPIPAADLGEVSSWGGGIAVDIEERFGLRLTL